MQQLQKELREELINNILPYWMNKTVDHEHDGFYGCINGREEIQKQASKGAVSNARILWTFSAAYRIEKNPKYLEIAGRAFHYLRDFFVDKDFGGVYWELDYLGNPVSTRKQTYAQGFAIYGFSEFYRATGREEALEEAIAIFSLLEKNAYDPQYGGYLEALGRDWQPIDDMKLSARDANVPKSMNTHLHILEPYTNLLRVWRNPDLIRAHERLIHTFCEHIVSHETHHQILFFDKQWRPQSQIVSYGHDIEAAWLLYEAAEVLENAILLARVKHVSLALAEAAYEGLQSDGSMIYETNGKHSGNDRHWWVQAETVAGSMYAYKMSGNPRYLEIAKKTWKYIQDRLIDRKHGEWFWSIFADGSINHTDDKAGFWKCPYHNARMCMEIMQLKLEN